MVVDSVQTCVTEEHSSAAGSVAQLRLVASQLMEMAKREGVATMLAGHVTKDGDLAGPRLLEHLVSLFTHAPRPARAQAAHPAHHACAGGPGWF